MKYSGINPTAFGHDNTMTFNFQDSQESSAFLNKKYVLNQSRH
ncbi:hypothetical protein [Methanobrevibacter sp.]